MVRDAHLAEDVTQRVFAVLAQNTRQLAERPVLSGWLHRTAQNLAAKTVRSEVRRRAREQEAAAMNELLSAEPETVWEHIAQHLDAALGELSETDHDALLLRYFERKSAREIAQTIGVSEEAAQKRVNRAVERLREFFAKRGITVGAGGLVVVISANAVQAAPVGLAVTISAAALAGTTIATTATATKAFAMTMLQKTFITAAISVAVGTGIYETRQASTLRDQVQNLQQQQAPLAKNIQQLQRERDDATRQLTALHDDNDRLNRNTAELLRLRGDLTRLRNDAEGVAKTEKEDPTLQLARIWKTKEAKLRQLFEQRPDQRIPEMKSLSNEQWLDVAKDADLDSARGVRLALSRTREVAIFNFATSIQRALQRYMNANKNSQPDNTSQLTRYFNPPLEDADEILSRYGMLDNEMQTKEGYKGTSIIQKVLIDRSVDNALIVGVGSIGVAPKGLGHAPVGVPRELIPALKSYMDANNHTTPLDNEELRPYITTLAQKVALEKFIKDTTE